MRNIYLFIVLVICFFSCEKQESVKKTEYFLHCLLIEGEEPKIKVCRTIETFRQNPFNLLYYDELTYLNHQPEQSEVSLIINKDGSTYNDVERVDIDVEGTPSGIPLALNYNHGSYITFNELEVEPGNQFEIEVLVYDNYIMERKIIETLKAKTIIPERVTLNIEQKADEILSSYGQKQNYNVFNLSFQDLAGQDDYYYLLIYNVSKFPWGSENDFDINDVNLDSLWLEYMNYDQQSYVPDFNYLLKKVNPEYEEGDVRLSGFEMDNNISFSGELFSDRYFEGSKKELELKLAENSFPGYVIFELYHVNEDYYKYYYALAMQNETQTDIYTEPVQLYTNIDNGLGVFAGASVSRQIVKIE